MVRGEGMKQAEAAPGLPELDQIVVARWAPEAFRRFQCVWLTHTLKLPAREIARADRKSVV